MRWWFKYGLSGGFIAATAFLLFGVTVAVVTRPAGLSAMEAFQTALSGLFSVEAGTVFGVVFLVGAVMGLLAGVCVNWGTRRASQAGKLS